MNLFSRSTSSFLLHHTQKPWRLRLVSKEFSTAALGHRVRAPAPPLAQRQRPLSTTLSNKTEQPHPSNHSTYEILPLPDLPPPPKGWPSFWVIRKEVEEYLYPLYERGWGVIFMPRKNYLISHDRYVAYLTTDYTFANFNCAAQFIADLVQSANKEKHHPSILSLRNATRPTISLSFQTDSALRPRWNEEDPSADPPLPRRVPGLTRRDLRFAILLEERYENYLRDGRALQQRGIKIKSVYDRPNWENLISRFIKCSLATKPPKDLVEREERNEWLQIVGGSEVEVEGGVSATGALSEEASNKQSRKAVSSKKEGEEEREMKCVACAGSHWIQDCTVREQYQPPSLCYLCLEPHWWLDCPQRQKEGLKLDK